MLTPTVKATAIWSPGLSPVTATNPVVLCAWVGVAACETWLVICVTATRLTTASPATTRPRTIRDTRCRHVGQRHQQRADRRVDHQHRVVHGHRVVGEPVHGGDQQRITGLVQRRVGEVGGRTAGQDPPRDQVRGLVGIGQGHALPAAEPDPQSELDQPARRDQQRPSSRRPPRSAVGLAACGGGQIVPPHRAGLAAGDGDGSGVGGLRDVATGRVGAARPDEQACQGKCLPRSKVGPGLGPGRRWRRRRRACGGLPMMRVPSEWPFNLCTSLVNYVSRLGTRW